MVSIIMNGVLNRNQGEGTGKGYWGTAEDGGRREGNRGCVGLGRGRLGALECALVIKFAYSTRFPFEVSSKQFQSSYFEPLRIEKSYLCCGGSIHRNLERHSDPE